MLPTVDLTPTGDLSRVAGLEVGITVAAVLAVPALISVLVADTVVLSAG